MTLSILTSYFERDLRKMCEEVSAYEREDQLWQTTGAIANSGGNLCLHIIGNLKHFVGAVLGHTGYVRNRDEEFSAKNIPRQLLLTQLSETIDIVKNTLTILREEDLEKIYPLNKQDREWTTLQMLLHLLTHLSYHLGQLNYHRRMQK